MNQREQTLSTSASNERLEGRGYPCNPSPPTAALQVTEHHPMHSHTFIDDITKQTHRLDTNGRLNSGH